MTDQTDLRAGWHLDKLDVKELLPMQVTAIRAKMFADGCMEISVLAGSHFQNTSLKKQFRCPQGDSNEANQS